MKLTKKEIESLNLCLAHTQTAIMKEEIRIGCRSERREKMQEDLDLAKAVVAKLKATIK